MHELFTGDCPQLLAVPALCCTGDSQPSLPMWDPFSFWGQAQTRTFCWKLITEETLSWQVGFMKNGKVKSLEVSYYSNGGNSVDLSHGVSKIFWWLIKQKVCFCATFCSALPSESCCLQHCLYMQLFDMTENRFWRAFGASTNALWAKWPVLACAT